MDQTDNTTYPEGIEVFEILVSRDATTEKKKTAKGGKNEIKVV